MAPSISSQLRSSFRRTPLCEMSWRIVRKTAVGMTPIMMMPSNGCLLTAAIRANDPGQQGRDEIEEAQAQKADEAFDTAIDTAMQRADLLFGEAGQVDLHQVIDHAERTCRDGCACSCSRPDSGAQR